MNSNAASPLELRQALRWVWIRARLAAIFFLLSAAPYALPDWRLRLHAKARRDLPTYTWALKALIFVTAFARLGLDKRAQTSAHRQGLHRDAGPSGHRIKRHCHDASRIASMRVILRTLNFALRPGLSPRERARTILAIALNPEAAIRRLMKRLASEPVRCASILSYDPRPRRAVALTFDAPQAADTS
ncbi:MAG: hypothetical protein AB7J28_08600 [Hyphomonadaceae bacterium]